MTDSPPCRHYSGLPPSHCLAGRHAPHDCAAISLDPAERIRCEIWTRVMGYHRPVSAFNAGKQAEHAERRYFKEPGRA